MQTCPTCPDCKGCNKSTGQCSVTLTSGPCTGGTCSPTGVCEKASGSEQLCPSQLDSLTACLGLPCCGWLHDTHPSLLCRVLGPTSFSSLKYQVCHQSTCAQGSSCERTHALACSFLFWLCRPARPAQIAGLAIRALDNVHSTSQLALHALAAPVPPVGSARK
jgi:hypothetical protein